MRERSRLVELWLTRLINEAESCLKNGAIDRAEQLLKVYLETDPYSETAVSLLMKVYRDKREFNRAAGVYKQLTDSLNEGLGISPLKETTTLYYSILDDWNNSTYYEDPESPDYMIGRRTIFKKLQQSFQRGNNHYDRHAIICGEAGVGKTFLLNYFLKRADLQDYKIVSVACFKSRTGEVLHSWQTIMSSLYKLCREEEIDLSDIPVGLVADLFPAFLPMSNIPDSKKYELSRQLIYESVLLLIERIAEHQAMVFVFEDIQWMDKDSLHLTDQLLHRIHADRVKVLMTCRTPAYSGVVRMIDSTVEDGLLDKYDLSPFSEYETFEFIEHFGDKDFSEDIKNRIYRDTNGNAFLLVQLIGSLLEHGTPYILSNSAEEIMSYRLSGVSYEAQKTVNLIAMFEDYAPLSVLECISEQRPSDLLYLLQELKNRSIIAEYTDVGGLAFIFTQPEFRDLAYSRIAPLDRRILHRNIAEEMTRLYDGEGCELSINTVLQIIYHYHQGEDELNAYRYKLRQSEMMVLPITTLSVGIDEAGDRNPFDEKPILAMLEIREKELNRLMRAYPNNDFLREAEEGLLYTRSAYEIFKGNYETSVPALEKLIRNTNSDSMKDLSYEQLIFYGIQIYDTEIMSKNIDAALALTKNTDPRRYAVNSRYHGFLKVEKGEFEEGIQELMKSITLIRKAFGDAPEGLIQCAYAYNYLGEAYRRSGENEKAAKLYQQAIDFGQRCMPCTSIPIFYCNYAVSEMALGHYELARKLFERSQELMVYIEPPSGFRTVSYAYLSLYEMTEGNKDGVLNNLEISEQYANMLSGRYDKGVISIIKAILIQQEEMTSRSFISEKLNGSSSYYAKEAAKYLDNIPGEFEHLLIDRVMAGELALPGFFDQPH